ncbi:MAG TPA: hypothetical protein DIT64_17510 [Verrucomicrobiales bacterium]|nr:hypothetical protein [Verrucomicrobiales bacterium]
MTVVLFPGTESTCAGTAAPVSAAFFSGVAGLASSAGPVLDSPAGWGGFRANRASPDSGCGSSKTGGSSSTSRPELMPARSFSSMNCRASFTVGRASRERSLASLTTPSLAAGERARTSRPSARAAWIKAASFSAKDGSDRCAACRARGPADWPRR